jgi:hypothetical protein
MERKSYCSPLVGQGNRAQYRGQKVQWAPAFGWPRLHRRLAKGTLVSDDVALEIEDHAERLPILYRFAAPSSLAVPLQVGNV